MAANCPHCKGNGGTVEVLRGGDFRFPEDAPKGVKQVWKWVPCEACNTTGRIDKRHLDRAAESTICGY